FDFLAVGRPLHAPARGGDRAGLLLFPGGVPGDVGAGRAPATLVRVAGLLRLPRGRRRRLLEPDGDRIHRVAAQPCRLAAVVVDQHIGRTLDDLARSAAVLGLVLHPGHGLAVDVDRAGALGDLEVVGVAAGGVDAEVVLPA